MTTSDKFPPIFENKLPSTLSKDARDEICREFSEVRNRELMLHPIKGNYDQQHLSAIHKHLFQDVSNYAGVIRNYGMNKGVSQFADPSQMPYLFDKELPKRIDALNQANNKDQYIDAMTDLHSTLDLAHPFREGNGRATRAFMNQLAKKHGYTFDFSAVKQKEWVAACVHSINTGQETLKRALFKKIVVPIREQTSDKLTPEQAIKKAQLRQAYATQTQANAIKAHPELKSLYDILSVAKTIAKKRSANHQEQQKIINKIEDTALTKLAKGERFPTIVKTKNEELDYE